MIGLTRLILHSDSIKTSDIYTFRNAAATLAMVYKAKYPGDTVKVEFVRSGKDIVKQIKNGSLEKDGVERWGQKFENSSTP
ncbi:MAG: hypothetical protein ACYSUB_21935 [Planctomycetota bacterium]|jgi:hypothetical protein